MQLINCKAELSLRWIENCVLTTAAIGSNADATGADSATFKITDEQLSVPVVTLSAGDNWWLAKQLDEGFKKSVYWNKYKAIDNKVAAITCANRGKSIRELLDSSYEGVKRLFVLAYNNTADDDQVFIEFFKKYFLPRVKIEKQYDEVRKISTGQGDGYTTGCLLDFACF